MILLLIIVGLLGIGIGFSIAPDECPRIIMGYNCLGEMCNHSRFEVNKAKERKK